MEFLFNFRLAWDLLPVFSSLYCLRGVCALYLHTFVWGFCCNFAYAAFCFRLCWHSCANQFAQHICIIRAQRLSCRLPVSSCQLAVCLSLSLSLDQYVHSVLHIKCHPHTKQLSLPLARSFCVLLCFLVQNLCHTNVAAGSRGCSNYGKLQKLSHVCELSTFQFQPFTHKHKLTPQQVQQMYWNNDYYILN